MAKKRPCPDCPTLDCDCDDELVAAPVTDSRRPFESSDGPSVHEGWYRATQVREPGDPRPLPF